MDTPFGERRAELERVLRRNDSVHITPATSDPEIAERWFTRFEGAGLDGVMAKPLTGVYTPDKRTLVKVKHERTADCAVAGYRIHKDGEGVGSLLLGLYDDNGRLNHVGVCAAFSVKFRRELLAELQPLTEHALDDHPWKEWAEMQAHSEQRMPGGFSRWNVNKDLSFVPLRVERVVEVTFGQLESGRFRHGVQFVRWRPDRTPESCRYEQLEVASPVRFDELLGRIRLDVIVRVRAAAGRRQRWRRCRDEWRARRRLIDHRRPAPVRSTPSSPASWSPCRRRR